MVLLFAKHTRLSCWEANTMVLTSDTPRRPSQHATRPDHTTKQGLGSGHTRGSRQDIHNTGRLWMARYHHKFHDAPMRTPTLSVDRTLPYEHFGTSCNSPVMPIGAESYCTPIATKDRNRLHLFGAEVLPEIFIGYALNSGGCWIGDLIITDGHDIENNVASEVHVKRFKYQ